MKHMLTKALVVVLTMAICLSCFTACSCDSQLDVQEEQEIVYETIYSTVSASSMEFQLSEENEIEFEEKLNACRSLYNGNNAQNADQLKRELYALNTLLVNIQAQRDIAYVLYCCDLSSNAAKENYLYAQAAYSNADQAFWSFLEEAQDDRNSLGNIIHDFLEAEYPVRVSAEGDPYYYSNQMAAIEAEFIRYGGKGSLEEIFPLYMDYLDKATQYAQCYGYDNYYDYANKLEYMRDYSKTEREEFRNFVKLYLIPLCKKLQTQTSVRYGQLLDSQHELFDELVESAYNASSKNYLTAYFKSLPPSARSAMLEALETDHILVGQHPRSCAGAFVTVIGNTPICYFHEDNMQLNVVSHELGHYYFLSKAPFSFDSVSLDLMETHSQANSVLLYSYLLNDTKATKGIGAYVTYELYNMVYQAILCTIQDEFDEAVFGTGQSSYTQEELAELMDDLIEEYGVADISDQMVQQLSAYWQRSDISLVGYDLSYAVAAVVAMQIYRMSCTDYEKAVECYRILIEDVNSTEGFQKALVCAGIESPFLGSTYGNLEEIIP